MMRNSADMKNLFSNSFPKLIRLSFLFVLWLSVASSEMGAKGFRANNRPGIKPKPGGKINCACGKGGSGAPKIVGGKLSDNHASPWIGALIYATVGAQPSQFCGSTLIADRYVLTAGHCVVGKTGSVSSYQVSLGSNKVNGTDAKRVAIAAITLHPKYNSETLDNDIALIRLTEVVKFTNKIRPICLAPPGGGGYVAKMANVAGWGTQSKGGNAVNQLRNAWVKVMENSHCSRNYSSANVKISPNMLCASLPGRDSCSGDSGGPLVIKEGGDTFRQIGVVSFGVDCGSSHYPGVYTRLTRYHKWIMDNTKDAGYCSK